MKHNTWLKGLVAVVLSGAMMLSVTGCDDKTVYQANDTDLSSLNVTESSPFYFGTTDREVNGAVVLLGIQLWQRPEPHLSGGVLQPGRSLHQPRLGSGYLEKHHRQRPQRH